MSSSRGKEDAGSFCVQESRAEELWQEGFCSSLPVELHGSTISQLEEDRREDKKQTPEVCGLPDSSWRRAEASLRAGAAGDREALGCASQAGGPAPHPVPSRHCSLLEGRWGLAMDCSSANLGEEKLVRRKGRRISPGPRAPHTNFCPASSTSARGSDLRSRSGARRAAGGGGWSRSTPRRGPGDCGSGASALGWPPAGRQAAPFSSGQACQMFAKKSS
ncbi:hypothetical protein R6Z07F_001643 [Ovis aries]